MLQITNPKWWVNMFIQTFLTMVFIYLIKSIAGKVNVPIVSDVVASV